MKRSQWNDQWWSLVKAEKAQDAQQRRVKAKRAARKRKVRA